MRLIVLILTEEEARRLLYIMRLLEGWLVNDPEKVAVVRKVIRQIVEQTSRIIGIEKPSLA